MRSHGEYRPLAVASTLAVLMLVGCEGPAAGPAGAPPPTPVKVAHPLERKVVEWDRYIGRFTPIEQVEVRSRVAGFVESIHFDEGAVVQAGQTLILIDQAPLQAAVAEAQGQLREAEAARIQADALVADAKAKKLQAEAQRLLTQNQINRAAQLVVSRTLTREEYEIREAEFVKAKADVEAADATIAGANAAVEAADALAASAQARLATAELNLSYATIKAPITGRIGHRLVTEGNLITGGSAAGTLLTTIVAIDPIHLYFDASEREYLKYMRLDREGRRGSSRDTRNPVYVKLADDKSFAHTGHMDFVDNRLGQATGTIRGRAIFRNQDEAFTPGMFAEIRIPGSGAGPAILIPDIAVGADQNKQIVLVVDEENKVERRPIETGPIVDGLRVVRSGLSPTDLIIVEGQQLVMPGSVVAPSEPVPVTPVDDGLPDDYVPVPESEWIRARAAPLATEDPASTTPVEAASLENAIPPIDAEALIPAAP